MTSSRATARQHPLAVLSAVRLLSGGILVLAADGPDLLTGPGPLRTALEQVPGSWPLLLDLRAVAANPRPDPLAAGVLAAEGQRRRRAGTGLAVLAQPELDEVLRTTGLSCLLLLHGDLEAAAAALRAIGPGARVQPISYRPGRTARRSPGGPEVRGALSPDR